MIKENEMCRIMMTVKLLLLSALCSLILFAPVKAQTQSSSASAQSLPAPQAKPTPTLEHRFFANILRDQRAIWTSPFHLNRGDTKWLLPLSFSTAALFATDRRSAGELAEGGDNQSRLRISRYVSRAGDLYTTGTVAATFYFVGRATHNARARETGLLGAEALIDSGIVVQALKVVTQRPRPRVDDASGEFFDRGKSFPSGHAISAWSLATVIDYEYGKRHPLVRIGAYGFATAVSLSRYTGRNHFLSDVLVGSALGYGIGRFVYLKHHDPSLDTQSGEGASKMRSKLIPLVAPQYHAGNRSTRAYGLKLAWDL